MRVFINAARQTDTNAFVRTARMRAHQIANPAAKPGDELHRVIACGHRFLGNEFRIEISHRQRRADWTYINSNDAGAVGVDVEESWFAAAGDMANRAFVDPALLDQLLSDGGNGAALKSRTARQACARNGLVLSDQIQDDAPIYIARRLTPGDLKII